MGLLIRASIYFLLIVYLSMNVVLAAETDRASVVMPDPDNTWLQPNFPEFNLHNHYIRFNPTSTASSGPVVRFTYPNGMDVDLMRLFAIGIYKSRSANTRFFGGRNPYDWGRDKYGIGNALFASPLNQTSSGMFVDTQVFRRFMPFLFSRELDFLGASKQDYPFFTELIFVRSQHPYGEYADVGQVVSLLHKPRQVMIGRSSIDADLLPPEPIECPVVRDYCFLLQPVGRMVIDLSLSVDGPKRYVDVRHGSDFLRPAIGARNGKPVAEGPATSKFPDGTEIPREAIRWAY